MSLELTNKSYFYKMDKQGRTYSAGNYIQYPVINHNEKNMKKNIYICITESYLAIQQKLTQYCKSTILQ